MGNTHRLTLKQNLRYVLAVAALVSGLLLQFAFAQPVHAATSLCYDGLAGVTTNCPNGTSFPIDGKTNPNPGTNPNTFPPDKCYRLDDPNKGWVTAVCTDEVFKDIVPIQKTPEVKDNAVAGQCPKNLDPSQKCDLVQLYLNPIINGLAGLAVVISVIAIILGGIQYSSSADNPQAEAKAKGRIINAVIALLAFLFLWTFLQWIIPGGLI